MYKTCNINKNCQKMHKEKRKKCKGKTSKNQELKTLTNIMVKPLINKMLNCQKLSKF